MCGEWVPTCMSLRNAVADARKVEHPSSWSSKREDSPVNELLAPIRGAGGIQPGRNVYTQTYPSCFRFFLCCANRPYKEKVTDLVPLCAVN